MNDGVRKTAAFVLSCLLLFVTGCAKLQGLMTLKRLGDSQKQIEDYLTRQKELFDVLVADIKEGTLREGMTKRQFIKTYGEPVLTRHDESLPQQEILLYRHPTEYFTSDRVYASFNETGTLIRWEYEPYQQSE